MNRYFDIFRLSARHVLRQRKRYFGVLISIAIGTAGIVIVFSMGGQVKSSLNEDLELLGGGTIVAAEFEAGASGSDKLLRPQWFRPEAVEAIKALDGVREVSLFDQARASMSWKDLRLNCWVYGVEETFWAVTAQKAEKGEFFGAQASRNRELVCVVSTQLAATMFQNQDPVGEFVRLNESLYKVVGVLGGTTAYANKEIAYIPFSTQADRFGVQGIKVFVRCDNWEQVEEVAEAIPGAVESVQPATGLQIRVARAALDRVESIFWWVELFIVLSLIGTFVLGGFGILNGMMAAVKARTREIGLKKAMGAEDSHILFQFLAEAVCLSFGAAIVGILLGRIGMETVCWFLETRPDEALFIWSAGLSLVFSFVLGVGAGFYPALKASRMELVTAIRYE